MARMAGKWMIYADESSSARLITVPYERQACDLRNSAWLSSYGEPH